MDESAGAYMSPLEFQSMMVSAGVQENASSQSSRRHAGATSSSRRLAERTATETDPNAIPAEMLATDSIKQMTMKGGISPKSRSEGTDEGVIYVIQEEESILPLGAIVASSTSVSMVIIFLFSFYP